MLTMKPNGNPGELRAITNWVGKLVLGVMIALLTSATIEGFLIWKNQAVQTYALSQLEQAVKDHMTAQRAEETERIKRDTQMAIDVAAAKSIVDESFERLDHRITRIEQVCCVPPN